MTLRTTILLVALLALDAAHLAYDGYFYATGEDLPGPWDSVMMLWLFATLLVNPVEPKYRTSVSVFWKTAFTTCAALLVLGTALFWLVQHTQTALGLSSKQFTLALRIAGDVAYAAAGAIMLTGWWRERHRPLTPPTQSPKAT